MSNVEDQLRDLALRLPAEGAALPPAAEVMRRGERRRRRRRTSRAAVAVTAAVAVGGFGLSRASSGGAGDDDVVTSPVDRPPGSSPSPSSPSPSSPSPSSTTATTAAPGADHIVMPDIVGLDADRAGEVLQSLGLRVVAVGPDGGGAGARVVAQEPAAGSEVEVGSDVRVTARREGP